MEKLYQNSYNIGKKFEGLFAYKHPTTKPICANVSNSIQRVIISNMIQRLNIAENSITSGNRGKKNCARLYKQKVSAT
ncbi:hypothetical protein BB561_002515 [Smittium simulii]|uniref:Uncharacterized protein n=1 Tax=Smittium simulii TaxID=133385 RepID=A0A2T9YQ41_9FUNG|nr:hypothetical protein BB561_002515 [Smittium simulii]